MFGTLGPDSPFDVPFYVAQLATMALWLLAFGTVRWQRRLLWFRGAALGLAIVSEIVLPGVWNLWFPATGIAQLRIFLGIGGTLVEAVLSCLWAVTSAADAIRPRWPAARPMVAIALVSLILWIVLD